MPPPRVPGLPNLVIAGVTKAGTTSLYRYLGQHPEVGVADVKEVDHYAPMVHGGQPPDLEAYARHFRACQDAPWRLEASPRYFIGGPALVRRLVADLERPKVLVSLRDPVSRMWSSYTYKRSKARLPQEMGFEQFIDACLTVSREDLVRHPGHATYRTLATGAYADYLCDWFAELGEDVRVVFFEDLAAAPAEQMRALCEWVELDTGPVSAMDFGVRNSTYQPRSQTLRRVAMALNARTRCMVGENSGVQRAMRSSYRRLNTGRLDERMSENARQRLRDFYRPTLPALRGLLEKHGRTEFPEWLAGRDG